jgi:hypothetical protein
MKDFLKKYEGNTLSDIKSDYRSNKKLDVNKIILISELDKRLLKHLTYWIKSYERNRVVKEVESSKVGDLKSAYDKYMRLIRLISRRSQHYTNMQWEYWRKYKESGNSKFEKKHYDLESKLKKLTDLRDTLLNRTNWKVFENEKYKIINDIDIENYRFTSEFIEYDIRDVEFNKESKVILDLISKLK